VQRTEQLDRPGHCVPTRFLVCHVRLDNFGDSSLFIDHALRLGRPFHIEVSQRDPGALAGKKDSRGAPVADLARHPRPCARHEGHFPGKVKRFGRCHGMRFILIYFFFLGGFFFISEVVEVVFLGGFWSWADGYFVSRCCY
jgi:hypothetical protein